MVYKQGGLGAVLFGLAPTEDTLKADAIKAVALETSQSAKNECERKIVTSALDPEDAADVTDSAPEGSSDPEDAKSATDSSLKRKVRTEEETRRTVIVKGVELKSKRQQLIKHLEVEKESVETVRFRNLPVDPKFSKNKMVGHINQKYVEGKSTMTAYVVLKDASTIPAVLLRSGSEFRGHTIYVDRATPETFSLFGRMNTIFVGRLPKKYTEDDLHKLFSPIGTIRNLRIVQDPTTHQSKGFGFVSFASKASVGAAISAFQKKEIDGHPLRVMRAQKESELAEIEAAKASKKLKGGATDKAKKRGAEVRKPNVFGSRKDAAPLKSVLKRKRSEPAEETSPAKKRVKFSPDTAVSKPSGKTPSVKKIFGRTSSLKAVKPFAAKGPRGKKFGGGKSSGRKTKASSGKKVVQSSGKRRRRD